MLLFSLAIEPGSRNLNWFSRHPPFLPFSITSLISHLHWFPSSPSPFSFEPPWLSPWSSPLIFTPLVIPSMFTNLNIYIVLILPDHTCHLISYWTTYSTPTWNSHKPVTLSRSKTELYFYPCKPSLCVQVNGNANFSMPSAKNVIPPSLLFLS